MKILFLPQTTSVGASSRARIYQYLQCLTDAHLDFKVVVGTSERQDADFLKGPSLWAKVYWFVCKIVARLGTILCLNRFDVVYIQRETLPYFFPFTELIIRCFAKRMIFDFDDAIFVHPKPSHSFLKCLMDPKSVQRILRICDRVVVSNQYLADYAAQYQSDVWVIPTPVKLPELRGDRPLHEKELVIGWVGSESTKPYLALLQDCFKTVSGKYQIVVKIIGAQNVPLRGIPLTCQEWDQESEFAEISTFDIGVMPLPDDPWTRGKGGYKLLQYMAAGVPAIASPIGINKEIIQDGENGFLARDTLEWIAKMEQLLHNPVLRQQFSRAGRETVQRYSVDYNLPRWLDALKFGEGE